MPSSPARRLRAVSDGEHGRVDEMETLNAAIAVTPATNTGQLARLHLSRAAAWITQKHYLHAAQDADIALTHNPGHATAYAIKGQALRMLHQVPPAAAAASADCVTLAVLTSARSSRTLRRRLGMGSYYILQMRWAALPRTCACECRALLTQSCSLALAGVEAWILCQPCRTATHVAPVQSSSRTRQQHKLRCKGTRHGWVAARRLTMTRRWCGVSCHEGRVRCARTAVCQPPLKGLLSPHAHSIVPILTLNDAATCGMPDARWSWTA